MMILGILNHYLMTCILIALVLCGAWMLLSFAKNRTLDIKVWIVRYIFLTYIAGVFVVTDAYKVFTEGIPMYFMDANFMPILESVKDILGNPSVVIEQMVYNVILFIPFGFLIAPSFPKYSWSLKKVLIVTVLAVCGIEILEFFSGRFMDIDDVIINTFGSFIGYEVYRYLKKVCNFKKEKVTAKKKSDKVIEK